MDGRPRRVPQADLRQGHVLGGDGTRLGGGSWAAESSHSVQKRRWGVLGITWGEVTIAARATPGPCPSPLRPGLWPDPGGGDEA